MATLQGTFLTFVKDHVTIMRPMRSTFARGVSSREKQAPAFSIRLPESQRVDIDKAAMVLDMDKTAFMRWAAHATAIEILKQYEEYEKSRT